MIPVLKRPKPENTDAVEQAIRDRIQFTVVGTDISGRHSAYRKHCFFVQCNASLIAIYDMDVEQWFMRHDVVTEDAVWTCGLVSIALKDIKVIEVTHKELKNVQRYGYRDMVRKRLNVAKEK